MRHLLLQHFIFLVIWLKIDSVVPKFNKVILSTSNNNIVNRWHVYAVVSVGFLKSGQSQITPNSPNISKAHSHKSKTSHQDKIAQTLHNDMRKKKHNLFCKYTIVMASVI